MTRRLHLTRGLCLAACLAFFWPATLWSQESEDLSTYELLDLFGRIFELTRSTYVESPEDQALIEAALQGMLRSLDPHSVYLNPEVYEDVKTGNKGVFGGLGIEVTLDDSGAVRVISPIDDTPAYRVGVQSQDLIIALDGESVLGLTLSQAVKKMRGPVGEPITLTIVREGEESFDVEIVRDNIVIKSVSWRLEASHIGYIRISSFTEQTQPGLEDALRALEAGAGETPIEGYILDLRNNPGGLLDQAVSVSDSFLHQGEIVSTRGRTKEDIRRFQATRGDKLEGKPLVVLINAGSASASEIVAGALRDHNRAVLVGVRSFGKGSVQTLIPLRQGKAAVKLTTQRYYTPSGGSIQAQGIEPHVFVSRTGPVEEEVAPGSIREENLPGALDSQKDSEEADGPEGSQRYQDHQLHRAMEVLEALMVVARRDR